MTRFTDFEHLTACTVCGAEGALKTVFPPNVARCTRCGTLLRDSRPTQAQIKASYDGGSTYDQWEKEDEPRRAMWQRRVKQISNLAAAQGTTGRRLLDIGTGDGHFPAAAREAGWQPLGTEFSDDGAARARARGIEVLIGQLEDIDFGDRQFDLITIWHVLEHVPYPQSILQICKKLLAPGGILLVAVPNEANTLVKHRLGLIKGENPFGEILPGGEIHLTHFEPHSLKGAFIHAGLKVIDFGVDDIYYSRSLRTKLQLALQGTLAKTIGWHMTVGMYCAGTL